MATTNSPDTSNPIVVKLSEVCQIINGFFFPKTKEDVSANYVPYIKSGDIKSKKIVQANSLLAEAQVKNKNITAIAKGALLIGLTGLGVGQVATLDIDAIIDPTVCAVVNNWFEALDTDYLYYFLLTSIPFLMHNTKTSTRINSLLLRDLELKVLPIEQQKNIVKQIEQKIESFNTEVQDLEKGIANLEIAKSTFLNTEFANLPDTYKSEVTINTVAKIQAGNTPTESMKVYYGNEFVFFKPDDIKQGTNMLQSKTQLSARGAVVAKLIPPDSLILVCVGALTGKVGITKVEATCNKSMMAIILNEQVITKFLYYQFLTNYIQQQIRANTALNIIIKSKVEKLNCQIIPLSQQQALVEKIDTYLSNFEKEVLAMQQRRDAVIVAKDTFLKEIFKHN